MRVTVLGSGTPIPNPARAAPAFLLHLPDRLVQVDCGGDSVRRLLEAGVLPRQVTQLFITHLHSDHTLGFAHFVFAGWTGPGRTHLEVYGPPGTRRLRDLLFEMYREDIAYRLSIGRTGRGMTDMKVTEVGPGLVYEDATLRVTATEGVHSFYVLGYRFEHAGRAVVFTGDTAPCDALVELVGGADIVFHECTLAPGVRDFFHQNVEGGAGMWEKMQKEHSTPEKAGRVAQQAGAKRLVLIHLHPALDREATLRAARSVFSGEVVLGEDLQEFAVG